MGAVERFERELIQAELQRQGGNVARCAEALKVAKTTLHDKIKRFESPLHEGYDQYVLKLHDRAAALVMEWADVIGWANYKITTVESEAGYGKEVKARTTGQRILHVEPHPGHPGGNRFGLKNMPLSWEAFAEALASIHNA